MEKKDTSAFYKNLRTCKKMKTTLTKKDDYSITIETQVEHTMYCEQTNKRPTSKRGISFKVVGWLVRIVCLFASEGFFLVFIL